MASLLTNSAAMTALQTLRTVSTQLATTQNRISTGQRVATASDNAAYWSIATSMRSDIQGSFAVQDALGLGAATVDTTYTALTGTAKRRPLIKAQLVAAQTAGIDRTKIQADITPIQHQLTGTAASPLSTARTGSQSSTAASYNASKSVVSSFSRVGGMSTSPARRQHQFDQAVRQEVRWTPATNVVTPAPARQPSRRLPQHHRAGRARHAECRHHTIHARQHRADINQLASSLTATVHHL